MGYTGLLKVQFYKQDKKVVIHSAVTGFAGYKQEENV